LEPLHHYRLIHESPSTIISVGEQEIKFVKIFEYVKGARIEGKAPDGSVIKIATNITTNQGREFIYSEVTISNGSYEFVVPYSTEEPLDEGTNFDVFASQYKIQVGHLENEVIVWDRDMEKEIRINEDEIMNGKTIRVDLL
jgi:dolichyl-diphosphooligosaccharide--protein glycosyltransferase